MAKPTKPHSRRRLDLTAAGFGALLLAAILVLALAMPGKGAMSWSRLGEPWPDPSSVRGFGGIPVAWPSTSPFVPEDIGAGEEAEPPTTAVERLYLPSEPHPARSVPAVILLHGSGGVLSTRELTYAPQMAKMAVAALVVDAFGARRERGTGFIERLLNITETMMLAEAYSGLRFLAEQPEIDPNRVVLIGFSYGAMATMFALHAQIADALAFAGSALCRACRFYGPLHRPLCR
jgi:acetyl esterase/lipase